MLKKRKIISRRSKGLSVTPHTTYHLAFVSRIEDVEIPNRKGNITFSGGAGVQRLATEVKTDLYICCNLGGRHKRLEKKQDKYVRHICTGLRHTYLTPNIPHPPSGV